MKQASSNRTTEEFPAAAATCGVVRAGRLVVFRWLRVAAKARRDRVPLVYRHEISLGMREMAKQCAANKCASPPPSPQAGWLGLGVGLGGWAPVARLQAGRVLQRQRR